MKKIILLFALFFSAFSFAQVTKLSTLSSSKFLDSRIIYEDNNEDIYGYLLLFEKNKANKDTHELEYVLLDKNLNKVGSNTFNQSQYSSMWVDLKTSIYFAKKNKDNIYISIADIMPQFQDFYDILGVPGYRVINLKDLKISDQFYLHNFSLEKQVKEKLERKDFKDFKYIKPTKNNGFIVFDETGEAASMRFFMKKNSELKDIKQFRFFDMDFNQKWVYNYNQNSDKSFYQYLYFTGDKNDMIFKRYFYDKPSDSDLDVSYEVIDSENGKKKFDFTLANKENILVLDNIQFQANKIVVFASVYDYNEKGEYKFDKKRGYAKIVYDRQTGKELTKDYFRWESLAGKLDINEFGKVKDYGFIHFLEFDFTNDGKVIVVGEGYKPEGSSKILDLFMFVLDDKMKLLSFNKVDKFKNKIDKVDAYGSFLEGIGAFDYMYSQKLPGGGYAFYYSDNEKLGNKARKDPNWILGVVTYVDGVFDYQKVPLTTKNGQIYPINAKNGYVLLREVSNDDKQKDSEIRLEKINY